MAAIPPLRRLSTEDYRDQSKWIGPLLAQINDFFERTSTALRGLTIADNFAGEIKAVELDGTFPVRLLWSQRAAPILVQVGSVERSDGRPLSTVTITTTTGDTTIDSNVIFNLASGSTLKMGQSITGSGIADDTQIVGIYGTTLQLSRNATATITGATLSTTIVPVPDAVQVRWSFNQLGQLQIDGVAGITPTPARKYRVRLLCLTN